MILTDTHCHLDLERFDADREEVLARAAKAGVRRMLVPGLNLESSRRVLVLAEKHADVHAAVGIHPTEVTEFAASDGADLQHLASSGRVAAIGEIGLDYYWIEDEVGRTKQRRALRAQLEISEACGLPVVLHMREQGDADNGPCARDMLSILSEWTRGLRLSNSPLASRPGVLHSFAGSLEVAASAIDLAFYIGITGPITYPKAERLRAVVKALPLERLLIETDSPFLAPQPHRGKRNEPAFVAHIADRIAQIQMRTPGEVAKATTANAARLFAWREPD